MKCCTLALYTRYVGAPDGYKYDTITLFKGGRFSGHKQYFDSDNYSFQHNYFGRSAAITG